MPPAYASSGSGSWEVRRVGGFRESGWSQRPRLFGFTGNYPEKNRVELQSGECRHASLAPPPGVPRERCPSSGRVGGASIRVLKSFRREASARPSLLFPELERVTASDIFPAYVHPLARRCLSAEVWRSDLCYRMRSDKHDLRPSVTLWKNKVVSSHSADA